ncbi:glycosyltransferase family 9 protein [Actinosynnema sp. NPDC047251]|uniref:Glycosyltransferase, family 9 n=1 Tax=Saccharothrix espanaensis (strain ATCC 51144 / DSM 44229 / JCM 9112 / NBRC 15066 / NRRL 15764) TaxID=1179773 RepID=K0K6V0_SACES|nr:glycosyltransferase family 9 protein [Saccharothrix espanaensis]CCH32318.1 Glycosyltransferase, family 9 [Saccharothrix espanaensis DSM 44229]
MNVLVLRALGLGDLLTAVPALRGLRRAFPAAVITLAAPGWLADVVARIDAVDRHLPVGELEPIPLREPDLAVNLHGRGPQSTALLRATRPGRLIALDGRDDERHEVLRWCDLLERHGIPCDPDDLRLPPVPRNDHVVVHPGASHGARRWPADRWAAVARALGPEVVVTGSTAERPLVESVGRPAIGPLGAFLDLVGGARVLVCGDTGAAHVATAYGTPSVVLFGPVSPALWGPRNGPHRALWHARPGDTFADRPGPGLLEIDVAEVLTALGGVPWRESVSSERATSA